MAVAHSAPACDLPRLAGRGAVGGSLCGVRVGAARGAGVDVLGVERVTMGALVGFGGTLHAHLVADRGVRRALEVVSVASGASALAAPAVAAASCVGGGPTSVAASQLLWWYYRGEVWQNDGQFGMSQLLWWYYRGEV
jgi:hypothetical protein